MRERWRLFKDRAPGWQATIFAGWSSCTLGVDVESDHCTVTFRVPFVWLVVEWWRA